MQTPKTSQNLDQDLKSYYESIRSRVGDQSAKEILLGAKNSVLGNPRVGLQEQQDLLRLYQQVEKSLFGKVQLLKGEKEIPVGPPESRSQSNAKIGRASCR